MLWLASRIIHKSKGFFLGQQTALGVTNGYVEEMITGLKVVKVFCHEQEAIGEFEKLNEDLRLKSTKAQLYSGIMMPVMQNLNTINFALTAAVGGILSIVRGLDIGGLAAFLQYSRQFARPANEISNQFNSLQAALAGAERIFQIMDESPEPADSDQAVLPGQIKGEVIFEDVDFGYDPGKIILKDISLLASPGQKIALVGSTGAGKTTIMNLLPRFYDIQAGRILIDGIDIRNMRRDALRHLIARAAVARPSILILDEATNSIDTRTEIAIQEGMDQLMKGRTSFVIAHRLSTVRNADEILVLEKGKIIERGDHRSLLQQKGRYYELYQGQFD